MPCPICGRYDRQILLGKLGRNAIARCGYCGAQYYADVDEPIISRSEWGSFRSDGDVDMKVLRKRAEGAVKFFNNGNPRKEMQSNIFGYPFSIIDNGKLADTDHAYKGNVIIRCLSYREEGYYGGKVTLSYNDSYNDGRGQGGSGRIVVDDVRDVRIAGGYLEISGKDNGRDVSYRYLIQEHPDTKAFVRPIPRKKSIIEDEDDDEPPEPKPEKPRSKPKRTLDDFGDRPKPKPEVKPAPKPVSKSEPKPVPKPPARPRTDTAKTNKKAAKEKMFEVRVNGEVKGSFSSSSKAEKLRRELKARGLPAKVVGAYC